VFRPFACQQLRGRSVWVVMHSVDFLARAYAVLVGCIALWAWYIDVTLLHSPHEHMLPDMLLFFVGLPTSVAIAFATSWPDLFTPLVSLALLTLCAAVQVYFLCLIARFITKRAAASKRTDA
jgi:hypothetical protein